MYTYVLRGDGQREWGGGACGWVEWAKGRGKMVSSVIVSTKKIIKLKKEIKYLRIPLTDNR